MASIQVAGTVCAKEGAVAVNVREFEGGNRIASFSLVDREYTYVPKNQERRSLFVDVELRAPAAIDIAVDRLSKGSRVSVAGQLYTREYNGKTYLTVKDARVTYLDQRPEQEEVPF
jgi:single-strand DNA-binding protein